MGRSLHARFKRWDGMESDTSGEQKDAQGGWGYCSPRTSKEVVGRGLGWPSVLQFWERHKKYKKAFLARSLGATDSVSVSNYPTQLLTLEYSTSNTFFLKTTNTLFTLSKCLPVAAHLAPAPAAAIVAPARAAATKLPSQCANPPPSARHWEATTGRTSTGPSRSDEGPMAMQSHGQFIKIVHYLP
ncbi:hypothetical protein E4U34_004226 [Claviceps purpurea]|nr:hypothetical protein E4U34_004226 [Claviceps purpurea]